MTTNWDQRYQNGDVPWSLDVPSPALISYIEQLNDVHAKVLIPGAGIGHEAQYLIQKGYSDVTILDISPTAIKILEERWGHPEGINLVSGDFFTHESQYDLILEQTFLCAIDRVQREAYVQKMHQLLLPQGKIAGVLFASEFEKEGPPHGGCHQEYSDLFSKYFKINTMEPCYNSISPRLGNELFFICQKL